MGISVNQLISDIKSAATGVLQTDVSTFRGFSERQVEAIAKQAEFVTAGIATGQITAETRDFFLDSIEDMTLSFARSLRGLLMVTIEKLWNAVVGVIWKAINTATGLALPVPATH